LDLVGRLIHTSAIMVHRGTGMCLQNVGKVYNELLRR
jgi:hypothetical protein